jgi:DnaJ-class molecular chaperone
MKDAGIMGRRSCGLCVGTGFLENPTRQCGRCLGSGYNRAERARRAKENDAWCAKEAKRAAYEERIARGEIDGKDN